MEDEEIESGSDEGQSHQQLLQQVESVTKRSRVEQRTEGAAVASEYHLTSTGGQGSHVSLKSLLGGLGGVGSKSLLALKKRLSTVEDKYDPIQPPLNKIQADRANRKAANQETCHEVGKWAPIVKKNREAEHLTFPLQKEHVPLPSLSTKLESFTPCTELEREVAAILASSSNVEMEDEEFTEAERKSLFQMTMEEVMQRKKELQKHRALVSYYEQKCRRVRRIKSKKFHRVQRKRQEKLGKKAEVSEEELIKLRVQERMTLKHSNKAKWARKQHSREHRDPATQQALSEHHDRKIQLKQKVAELEEDTSDEDDEADKNQGTPLSEEEPAMEDGANPWLRSSDAKPSGTPKADTNTLRTPHGGLIDTGSFMVDTRGGGDPGSGLKRASKQLLAVREAFAGDDVVAEFEREKAQVEALETVDDTPVVLPGWGSWGGEGVRPPKKTPKARPRPPKKRRADAGVSHVIIPEEMRNKKIVEHLVRVVPWPYTSKDQFNKTHSMPIGRNWNTEGTFQQLIKPHVTTCSGEVIQPLELTEEVESYIKRSKRKKMMNANDKKIN